MADNKFGVVCGLIPSIESMSFFLQDEAIYKIRNKKVNFLMDVPLLQASQNNAVITLFHEHHGGLNQRFIVHHLIDNLYIFSPSIAPDKAISIENSSVFNNAFLVQSIKTLATNQIFKLHKVADENAFKIENIHSKKFLDLYYNNAQSTVYQICQYSENLNDDNQIFYFDKA